MAKQRRLTPEQRATVRQAEEQRCPCGWVGVNLRVHRWGCRVHLAANKPEGARR